MRRILTFLLVITWVPACFGDEPYDSLVAVLVDEIGRKEMYVERKQERIRQLWQQLEGLDEMAPERQFAVYNDLYHQYKTFVYDSAFAYARQMIRVARRSGNRAKTDYARLKLAFILVSSGMFKETFDSLEVVNARNLPDSAKAEYFRLLARAYSDLSHYNSDRYYRQNYRGKVLANMDSALRWCDQGSAYCAYLSAVRYAHSGAHEDAIDILKMLLERKDLSLHEFAMNYFELSNAYKAIGDTENCIRYAALAAIADIRAATKETAAMHNLARLLYEKGDIAHAYVLIRQALDDAEFYGARQRKVEIGSILPVIAAANLNNVDNQRRGWLAYSAVLTLLVALVVVFAVIIFRQLKKLKAAELVITRANAQLKESNHKLLESDRIKEEYIGYYFGNNSEYIEKIETFKRNLDRKILSKRVDDIRLVVDTLNPAHEREELYFNFDKIFLKLFPDFLRSFNAYFREEDRIVLKEGQLLNTELRIFALIRLGIHDAEKIARILGYSVNTIYAYKNRVKSKSILPNEEFEGKIMQIRTVPSANE